MNSTADKTDTGIITPENEAGVLERLTQAEKELQAQIHMTELLQNEKERLSRKLEQSENECRQLRKNTEFVQSMPGRAARKLWSVWRGLRGKAASASMPAFHRYESSAKPHKSCSFKLRVSSLRELRVACIMDRFSFDCFSPECHLFQLTPDGWRGEMASFDADMLFIESAWQGKDNLWYRKVAHAGKELYALTEYCRVKNIPIVFWTKEDPVHYDAFFGAAQLADFVFTTEIDCVQKYKTRLGHDNVYLMHFAAQPAIHNPIEKYQRRDRFCFAGAYYHNYPQRCHVFDEFAEVFDRTKGFDIYDRNFGNARPEHAFPERYNDNILGSLDPSEIDVAYKGYNYGVNMNSISQSQTMFARRVFELFASNTIVVGNFSRGLANLFGELTISTDDASTLATRLNKHCSDEKTMRRLRLLCLRRVLSEHLYEDRLAYIARKVYGVDLLPKEPSVELIGFAADVTEAERIIAAYRRQDYRNRSLTLVTDVFISASSDVRVISTGEAAETVGEIVKGDWVAVFDANDYYGEHYLSDLMLTRRYSDADAFGKADYYRVIDGKAVIDSNEHTYRFAKRLEVQCSVIKTDCIKSQKLEQLAGYTYSGEKLFCTDEFSYCRGWLGTACPTVDDLPLVDTGLHIDELQQRAEAIAPVKSSAYSVDLEKFCDSLKPTDSRVICTYNSGRLIINSTLSENEACFIWCRRSLSVEEFTENGEVDIIFMGSGTVGFRGYCTFYDKNRNRLATNHAMINRTLRCQVPEGASYFLLSLKVVGVDSFALNGVSIGRGAGNASGDFLSRSNVLVLTNHYPSVDMPYHNMFVHKRVLEYRRSGLVCDVLRIHPGIQSGYREYMGVNIAEGQQDILENVLKSRAIDTVCVHFLDRTMWEALKEQLGRLRIIIWCHGADIQPWWRRSFNYTDEQLEVQKKLSDERMTLWREVFAAMPDNDITMVFVSQYAADETMTDYGVVLDRSKYRIIHNFIDTDLFTYQPKSAEQRKRILTIKSFSSRTYANDLTREAIIELSERAEFADMEFDIYGRGQLFEQETADLQRFENVHLHEQVLSHDEIAALHKSHGIYIASTRSDTQGVSRDEAMSSGLVPIANAVTAIPEFVDESCGILVPAEDSHGIAEGILRLYNEPEQFLHLSAAAAARVRSQTSRQHTIEREISLIKENE